MIFLDSGKKGFLAFVDFFDSHNYKACCNYVKFVSVCYLVPVIGLQRLKNDRNVLSICQIRLANSEKEVHVYLKNVDPEGRGVLLVTLGQ